MTLMKYISGCFVMAKLLLCLTISVHGTRRYMDSKLEVACQQEKLSYCGGSFIRTIANMCITQGHHYRHGLVAAPTEHVDSLAAPEEPVDSLAAPVEHVDSRVELVDSLAAPVEHVDSRVELVDSLAASVENVDGHNGHACSRNDECRVKESVCFEGVCLCTPGLYYNPGQKTCVRECAEYSDKMDIYKGAGIVRHNDKSLSGLSEASCIVACVQERSFICHTFDFLRDGYCHLSKSGYLDVKEGQREAGWSFWILGQRQCK